MAATGGTWVAWGSGTGDFEVTDAGDTLRVPPERPAYRLRRLRLNAKEISGFYLETANRVLWPLCHSQLAHFTYDADSWSVYRRVNERFAAAGIAEARGGPATCWIQDYHLALVAGILRRVQHLFIHQFWHIPWPPPDLLRALPPVRTLLQGLLGNHLLGFQTAGDVRNFLASVRRFLRGATVEPARGLVRFRGRRTVVRDFPISIDAAAFAERAAAPATEALARQLRRSALPDGGQLLLGVDRVDYTKGIPRRFLALARLFEEHPELRGKVTLLQVGVPTRTEIPDYAEFEQEVAGLALEINGRFGHGEWMPIRLVRESLDQHTLVAYYRAADICIVTPLLDGMNLVAKEFVACQAGRLGTLVLSRFAGAAREMREALLVNPYDLGALTGTLYRALSLSPEERERRLGLLRRRVERHTIHDWMAEIFAEVARLRGRG
jgi:trehalose 6-phosphate synthase